jgi:hypothetical protein
MAFLQGECVQGLIFSDETSIIIGEHGMLLNCLA